MAALTAEFGAPAQLLGLRDVPAPAHVFGTVGDKDTPSGAADIEPGAYAQLQLALRLPIAERGALLPDAHQGYALPIGGVFRSYNSVAPGHSAASEPCRVVHALRGFCCHHQPAINQQIRLLLLHNAPG